MMAALLLLGSCDKKADDETGDNKKPNTEQPGNGDDNGKGTALSIDKNAISAAHTAGTYELQVTDTQVWSAEVNAAATWCTASPATGTSNGTVTVNVAANAATVTRTTAVTIAAGAVTRTVSVAQAAQPATPPYAASTLIWTFGEQQWSDAIRIPACNKTSSFTDSYTEPQCRSYTSGTNTWYYYNWPYVVANPSTMCPPARGVCPVHRTLVHL
jgi:hypothetical protein